jgi:hypothetical protein
MTDRRRWCVALLIAGAACGNSSTATKAASEDVVLARWRQAGLTVSAMTAIDAKPYSALDCRGGTVSGVDVVICRYDTGEDAKGAEELGLVVIGEATGAALAKGTRMLTVIDRRNADPSGRTINAVVRAFRS